MRVTVSGLAEVQEQIDGLKARLRDMSPVLDVAVADTQALIDDAFDAQASPGGVQWAPRTAASLQIRTRRRGDPGRTLQDTLRLRSSIAVSRGPTTLRFGTNVAYAGLHQLGGSVRVFGRGAPKNVPARQFLPVESQGGGRYRLMTSGPAGAHWASVRRTVAEYLRTGRIT